MVWVLFFSVFSKLEREDQQKRSKYSRHSLLLCSTLFLCFQRKRFGWRVKTKSQQKVLCEAEIGNRFTFIIRKLTTLLPLPLRMFECFLPTFANCSRDWQFSFRHNIWNSTIWARILQYLATAKPQCTSVHCTNDPNYIHLKFFFLSSMFCRKWQILTVDCTKKNLAHLAFCQCWVLVQTGFDILIAFQVMLRP